MERDERIDLLLEIRNEEGLNRKEFASKYGIPYPTITDWELGHRRIPEYLLRLLAYQVRFTKLEKNKLVDEINKEHIEAIMNNMNLSEAEAKKALGLN